ncbi:DinB family protein [Sphingobacterium sp. 18053]|uniref:DinB family protein n=1 Tax=Sphingobacterium sp. 18053 TaxID=2681401 RepID=UPI00135837B6|nr:DinB family protein [Sphingobacterium sp. 18053]
MEIEQNLFVKMVLDMWNTRIQQTDKLLTELSDEQLLREVATSKNRGIYLLGHLTATHDQLFRLLDICNPIFPDYKNIFLDNPDKAIAEIPTVNEVKQSWTNVNIQLSKCFKLMHTNEWFQRHTSVSQEDFEREPHRNKLNIVLTRSNHLSYHLGQMILLKR